MLEKWSYHHPINGWDTFKKKKKGKSLYHQSSNGFKKC